MQFALSMCQKPYFFVEFCVWCCGNGVKTKTLLCTYLFNCTYLVCWIYRLLKERTNYGLIKMFILMFECHPIRRQYFKIRLVFTCLHDGKKYLRILKLFLCIWAIHIMLSISTLLFFPLHSSVFEKGEDNEADVEKYVHLDLSYYRIITVCLLFQAILSFGPHLIAKSKFW